MITIAYLNFWKDSNNDKWLSKFIEKNIGDIKHIPYQSNPDILICSVMGNINTVKNTKAKVKILFIGENVNRYPPYNNKKLIKDTFDIILGFEETNLDEKRIRFPLWLIYYNYYNMNSDDNIINYIENERNINKNDKNLFGTCVARHDRGGQRKIILNELSKYGKVLCPSQFNKNTDAIGNTIADKKKFIARGIFNICPENSKSKGYCTEKIFHALEAGTIPLYWGNDLPEKNLLNEDCYCFINVGDKSDVHNKVKHATNNVKSYFRNNVFKSDAYIIIDNYYNTLKRQIEIKLYRI
jgi:hypothetical protein